ncbi:hypothetical protein V6N13_048763 [Hibiscus sabdariffa]
MIQKKTPRNKVNLVRCWVKLEYNDGQNMIEHLNTFKGILNQISKIEMKIYDELQALLLLSFLPESWDILVVTLSNSTPIGKLITDTVSDSLMNEEARRKERGLPSQSKANLMENRGKSIEEGVRPEEEARLEVMISLEGNLNRDPKLFVTIVANLITKSQSVKISKDIRRMEESSLIKLPPRKRRK